MSEVQRSLDEAIKAYNRDSDRQAVDLAEQERQEVVQRFPLDQWPNLPLTKYALGQDNTQDSFCWWIEFGTPHVGSMKGGSARKHLIYRQRDGGWFYDRRSYASEQEAWQAVRHGFLEAFDKAKAGDWANIDQIGSISGAAALRTKTLHCYFPNDLLPITSTVHIRHFLELLGHDKSSYGAYDVVQSNRVLLEAIHKRSEFDGWSTKEIERFLYLWADPRYTRTVVKIAPGEKATYWDECLRGGYIRVGWGNVGDLRKFQSKEDFRAKFAEVYGAAYNQHQPAISKKSNELWTLRELEPGDLVVANQGTSRILGIGEVIEPAYSWTDQPPDDSDFNHIVNVKWDTSYAQDISPQKSWAMVTVAPVAPALLSQIMAKKPLTKEGKQIPVDPLFMEIATALDRKRQAILYGPPGTGKTYHARRFAVWWLMRQMGQGSPELLLTDRETFASAERQISTAHVGRKIWWVVANPKNWSWDRLFKDKQVAFSHGRLQRNYPLASPGDLVFGYQATPDKKLVALAKVSRGLYVNDGEQAIDLAPITRIEDGLSYDELQKDSTLSNSEPMRFRCQGTLFGLTEDEFDHLAALLIERNPDLRRHLYTTATGVGALTRLTFHASYSYEDFIEGFRPVESKGDQLVLRLEDGIFKRICRDAQANPAKPYLVLIDEINRANVAKVFGELITLFEKDKRGLLVSLPQSKEPFTIPPNVYVLGTMNTADRSVKLLDAALRRRFAFLELMPDSSLLRGVKVGNLALDDFLDELNRRIAAKEGREKQIGHSFLMDEGVPVSDPAEFARIFRQEILPLLQEYCYEDYRVLADYIGDKLVNRQAQTLDEERLADPDRLIEALESAFSDKEISE